MDITGYGHYGHTCVAVTVFLENKHVKAGERSPRHPMAAECRYNGCYRGNATESTVVMAPMAYRSYIDYMHTFEHSRM